MKPDPTPAPTAIHAADRRWGFVLPWLAMVLVLGFYGWAATLGTGRFDFGEKKPTLYTQLVEAFSAGQTYLQQPPRPELLRLADPYDPAQNGPYRLLDASLYHGRYYVYFGVTPVFVWLWPYYALSGRHPPDGLTVLLFCGAAFLVGCGLLARLRRVHFPEVGAGWLALAILAWGFGNFYGVLLAHHDFFEIAVACGALWLVATLALLHRVLVARRPAYLAMAGASLCYGLGIGSRPNLVFIGVIFALALAYRRRLVRRWEGGLWLAAALPAAVLLAGIFSYNHLRFGDFREFGLHYQLTVSDRPHWRAFSWPYVWFNAYYYFVSIPRLSVYFPFILEPAAAGGVPPPGHEGVHYVVGALWACPLLALALAAPLGGWRRAPLGSALACFGTLLLGAFGAASVVLLGIGFCSYRYMGEMQVPLLLLALAGGLGAVRAVRGPGLRRGLAAAAGAAVLWTGAVNLMLAADVEDMFQAHNPDQYRRLAEGTNRAVGDVAALLGWVPRRPVLTLRLPANRAGTIEPLLVTGAPPAADFFYVYYTTPQELQIGFESMGRGGAVSPLIPVDYARPHTIEIEGGLFLPPAGHPWMRRHAGDHAAVLKRSLVVSLDGKPVLDTYADFYPGKGHLAFGRSETEHAFGERFTGPAFQVAWVPSRTAFADERFDPARYGAMQLTLRFPALPVLKTEPILSTGSRNRAHLVAVAFLPGRKFRVVLLGSAQPKVESAAFPLPGNGQAQLKIALGSLYPTEDNPLWSAGGRAPAGRRDRYRIELDGRVILEGKGEFFPAPPETVVVGANAAGFGEATPAFSGQIEAAGRSW